LKPHSRIVSINGATVTEGILEPDELGGGKLVIGDESYDNCIPISLNRAGSISFALETYHGPVSITGTSVQVVMLGEPERRGSFPGTTRPRA
jgi:hypothetical protein